MMTFPDTEKKLKARISSYKSALKKEKRRFGQVDDGGGKRYLLFYLYFVLNDLKKSREYFDWYEAEFPDDVGEPIQKLCWALSLHRMKEDDEARYRLADHMLSNLYMIPILMGLEVTAYDMWHSSNLAGIDYVDNIPEEVRSAIRASDIEWLRDMYDSPDFRRIRERYVEIYRELGNTRALEKRKRLLKESRGLLDALDPAGKDPPRPRRGDAPTTPAAKGAGSRQEVPSILDAISPDEALQILKTLAAADPQARKKIAGIAEAMIRKVELEDIWSRVFWALEGLDVHELWDRAGPSRDGYQSPGEMAVTMFEEALAPFEREMLRLIDLGMSHEAKICCMGILKGIHRYETESRSVFKDWAVDLPGECFGDILNEWKKRSRNRYHMEEMDMFLKRECPGWAEDGPA